MTLLVSGCPVLVWQLNGIGVVSLSPNSWIGASDGKWETSTNWSLGVPPSITDAADFITNATTKTVTVDATTSGSFPDSMTISNLAIGAPSGSTNTLFLDNAGLNHTTQRHGFLRG